MLMRDRRAVRRAPSGSASACGEPVPSCATCPRIYSLKSRFFRSFSYIGVEGAARHVRFQEPSLQPLLGPIAATEQPVIDRRARYRQLTQRHSLNASGPDELLIPRCDARAAAPDGQQEFGVS